MKAAELKKIQEKVGLALGAIDGSSRRPGRPPGVGRVQFTPAQVGRIPDRAYPCEIIAALGIKLESFYQWLELKRDPLPFTIEKETGRRVFDKTQVVKFLKDTARLLDEKKK